MTNTPTYDSSVPARYSIASSLQDMALAYFNHVVTTAPLEDSATSNAQSRALSTLMLLWDPYTHHHQLRVGELAASLALRLGLPFDQVELIRLAGCFHDIGKLAVPLEILAHPGKLLPTEHTVLRTHPQSGHDILTRAQFPTTCAHVALQHHERLNGSGYPHGLDAKDILLETKVVIVADTLDAIIRARPYRPALAPSYAATELTNGAGTFFDRDVVRAALTLLDEGFLVSSPTVHHPSRSELVVG